MLEILMARADELRKIKDYFESVAPIYSNYSKKGFGKWLRLREEIIIKQSLKALPLGDVLELGSGTGYYSRYIYKQGCNSFTCVDFSSEMLKNLDIPGCVKINANIENFKSKKCFDTIFCAGALEFLEKPEEVFSNVANMLKPNGFFIILMPRHSLFGIIYRMFHQLHGFKIKLFKRNDLQNWVQKTSLNIVEYKTVSLFSIFLILSPRKK
jgi:2-polyprenyl-3-methyl-5-hydroxy-6-metoxy-1,4-benzoquinol methylase